MSAVVLGENVSSLAVGGSLARRDCDALLLRERELCALIMEPVMTTGAVKVSLVFTTEGTISPHLYQYHLILACFTVLLFFCLDWADKAHPDTAFLACGQVRIGIASLAVPFSWLLNRSSPCLGHSNVLNYCIDALDAQRGW